MDLNTGKGQNLACTEGDDSCETGTGSPHRMSGGPEDDINLLYLTDSEVILQSIHRWIGCGSKLNLSKSPDTDVLKKIILKLQKRVHAGVGDSPTNRTVYQWTVGPTTRSSTWTNTVRNRFRQKTGEIEAFRALEIGVAKWCKEHIPRKGNDLTDEGISLLDDMELWWEKQNLLWAFHNSRKKDRMNTDTTFLPHQKGEISATFTSDWYLRKGEIREKMGEWLKKTTVRSQDQWRILQTNTHNFPSNC